MSGGERRTQLTPAQRGLWFGELWERSAAGGGGPGTGSALYHVNASLRVRGRLDADALHRALSALVDRHPVLRARIEDGTPPTVCDPGPGVLAMPVVDLSHAPHTAREMAAARLADEVGRPFDLARGPLLRAALLTVAADEHVLVLVVHHLVCDGLSLGVVYRDLGALYRGFTGEEVRLAPAASWFDRDGSAAPGHQEAVRHWVQVLREAPALVEFPADRPRPSDAGSAGAALRVPVPARLWDEVLVACARWRVTPYMLVLAAYAVLLSRLGGQRDLVVGSPASGRASLADAETVGTFVTTTPLRLRIDPAATVRDLLGQVRDRALEAMRYGGVGLEEIVDGLGLPRSTAYAPLVQAFCGLDQLGMSAARFGPGIEAGRMATPCTRAKFELGLGFEVTASGVVADWEYRTDLFDAATVAALADAHLALLAAFTADGGDGRLAALDTVGAALPALGTGTAPSIPLPAGPPVPERIAARAALTPQAVALRTTAGAETTYRELDGMARRLAARIRAAGVGCEDTVLLALERGTGWAVGLLGTWYAGAAAVPLDLSLPDRRLRAMAEGSGARLAVAGSAEAARTAAARIGGEYGWLDLSGTGGPPPGPEDLPGPDTLRGSAAYVMFTSGSTGRPKAVAVGHDALAHHADAFTERFALTAADVVTQFAGLAFDVAFEEAVPVLCAGGTVLLLEDNTVAPRELERAVAAGGGTLVNLPSSYWAEWARDLGRRPRALPDRLRTVVIGSEAGRTADLERWAAVTDVPVVNAYGQTETAITSLAHGCTAGDADLDAVLPVGVPLPGVRAHLLDSALSPVPPGLPGELYLAGPGLARGYPGQPAATAGRFVSDPFAGVPGARMYRTGDRARIGADGALRFLGRSDDQVKVRGHRVQLAEVENAVAAHPQVAEVAARAVQGETTTEVAAYVVARPGTVLDLGDLRRFLADRVPGYQVPAHLVALEMLPRTTGGKLVPGALPDPVRQPDVPAGGPEEAGGPHPELLRVWREVLGREGLSADDNFFASGGDSIGVIRVVSLAAEAGMVFTARDVFAHQTVRDLAAAVGTARPPSAAAAGPAPEPVRDTGGHRLPDTAHLGIDGAERVRLLADLVDAERIEAAGPFQRWGLDRLRHHPGPGLYRMYEAFDLSGADVDVDLLVLAWSALVAHHPALRTSLHTHGGRDLQVVHRDAVLDVHRRDLGGLGTAEAAREFGRHLTALGSAPADPALRCQVGLSVFDRGPGAAYLVWHWSYLAFDGWSFPLLLADLLALHDGFRAGTAVPLPERPDPGVMARWWRERDLTAARSFWTGRLAGAPEGLVGTAPGTDPVGGERHVAQRVWLPVDRTASLTRRAAKAGLTLHTLVQGAYAIALGHVLGADDVLFATVVSGRADAVAGAESMVGCLFNRLPVRIAPDPAADCTEWLRTVQTDHAEAASYADVSPLDVQRWCGPADGSRLYDSEIVVENFPFDGRLQSRIADWQPVGGAALGDEALRLTVWPDPSLLLKVGYYRDLVPDERAVDILRRTARVLDVLADGMRRPVAHLLAAAAEA